MSNMKKIIAILAILFMIAYTPSLTAKTYTIEKPTTKTTIGVSVGDWAYYDVYYDYYLEGYGSGAFDGEMAFEVVAISGTTITLAWHWWIEGTYYYVGTFDVDITYCWWPIIPTDLDVGDYLPIEYYYTEEGTGYVQISASYSEYVLGTEREVLEISFELSYSYEGDYGYYDFLIIYDKNTGWCVYAYLEFDFSWTYDSEQYAGSGTIEYIMKGVFAQEDEEFQRGVVPPENFTTPEGFESYEGPVTGSPAGGGEEGTATKEAEETKEGIVEFLKSPTGIAIIVGGIAAVGIVVALVVFRKK